MNKNQPQKWANVPYETWPYEAQTEMKHKVLKYYLPIWAKILGTFSDGLNYIDGFGGIGAYHTDEDIAQNLYNSNNYGSPIFSMQIISELKKDNKISYANAIIIDDDSSHLTNIQKISSALKISLNVQYIHGEFDEIINEILDDFEGKQLYPTFFLIDPFGYSIKLKTIERIMCFDKVELIINFMYNAICRHIKNPNLKINSLYDELFGTTEWRDFAGKAGEEKELLLVELFRKQCKKFASFVYPFKLNFPEKNRPYYYLFHLSNHYLGCKLMKESFAINNKGEFAYKGETVSQRSLFELFGEKHENTHYLNLCSKCFVEEKKNPCKNCLLVFLSGSTITYEEFLMLVVDKLPFTESEIKRMLNDFEKEKIVNITCNRKRKTGFKKTDKISFNSAGAN